MNEAFDNPRHQALNSLKKSVSEAAWNRNAIFIEVLKAKVKQHLLGRNPIIDLLNSGTLSLSTVKAIHLDYRHAIVQVFTDALLMAQFQSRQLEPRLSAGAKMYPRFLLTLNILDEFGFRPEGDKDGYYSGNPAHAHYPLFEDLLDDLHVTEQERLMYQPSIHAQLVRNYLESSFSCYSSVLTMLAIAEEQVIIFSPPLRKSVEAIGVRVSAGYYNVHGVTSDETSNAADDEHEDDLWLALNQACVTSEYEMLEQACVKYCDLWDAFWHHHYNLALADSNVTIKRNNRSIA